MHNSAIQRQAVIQATDECVMCGLCLPHCPTYQTARNEAESPRGRITLVRALLKENLTASPALVNHLDNCLTCLNCQSVCPANVEYEKIIDMGRELTANKHSFLYKLKQSTLLFALSNLSARKLIKYTLKFFNLAGISSLLKKATKKSPILAFLPTQIETALPHSGSDNRQRNAKNSIRVALMSSCASEIFSDNTKTTAEFLLKKLGCEIVALDQINCCGALHQHTGHGKIANKLMQQFTAGFANKKYDAVVSLATGCGAHLNRYPQLLNSSTAKTIKAKHSDISGFVLQLLEKQKTDFKPLAATVLIHNPCTQKQVNNDQHVIRKLLGKIPQIELQYFANEYGCCGAGGMNSINQADTANQLMVNLMQTAVSNTKAPTYLVSSNIGCVLHFKSYLVKHGINITVCHPIHLLAQQLL